MSDNMNELEIEKIHTEIVELRQRVNESIARQTKFNVETDKIKKEIKWYEIVIIVSATLAIVAIAKLFL